MGNFSNLAITEKGRSLLADVQAGGELDATRLVMGSGDIPAGKTSATMTDVVYPVINIEISSKEKTPDGKVIFGGYYSNTAVTEDFRFKEFALYARAIYRDDAGAIIRTSDEVLYSYGNAGSSADLIPAYTTGAAVEKQLEMVSYVGNETNVNLTVESGIYVGMREFEVHAFRHSKDGADPITPAAIGAVKSNGDTVTGTYRHRDSTLGGSGARIFAENGYKVAFQDDISENTSARHILLISPYDSGLKKALQIGSVPKDGVGTWYDVYHTGNKPTYADIGAIPSDAGVRIEIPNGTDVKAFLANPTTPFGQFFQYSEGAPINAPLNDTKSWWFYDRSAAGVFARYAAQPDRLWWGGFNNGSFYGWFEMITTNNINLITHSDIGAAPFPTWGEEDIEAGSPSASPTGTVHYVVE